MQPVAPFSSAGCEQPPEVVGHLAAALVPSKEASTRRSLSTPGRDSCSVNAFTRRSPLVLFPLFLLVLASQCTTCNSQAYYYYPGGSYPGGSSSSPPYNGYSDISGAAVDSVFSAGMGISLLYTATYSSLPSGARILDCGNGPAADNVIIGLAGQTTNLYAQVYSGSVLMAFNTTTTNPVLMFFPRQWLVTIGKSGIFIYRDSQLFGSFPTGGVIPRALPRSQCYIGRSNWADGLFQGAISDLYLIAGELSWTSAQQFVAQQTAGKGLLGNYFWLYSAPGSFPPWSTLARAYATLQRTDLSVNFDSSMLDPSKIANSNWAANWTGYLQIKTAGTYWFWLKSDDGSSLYLDGALVIDNDGVHDGTATNMSSALSLTAGYHSILVTFFQAGNSFYIRLAYAGPDTNWTGLTPSWNNSFPIPPSALLTVLPTTTTTSTTTISNTSTTSSTSTTSTSSTSMSSSTITNTSTTTSSTISTTTSSSISTTTSTTSSGTSSTTSTSTSTTSTSITGTSTSTTESSTTMTSTTSETTTSTSTTSSSTTTARPPAQNQNVTYVFTVTMDLTVPSVMGKLKGFLQTVLSNRTAIPPAFVLLQVTELRRLQLVAPRQLGQSTARVSYVINLPQSFKGTCSSVLAQLDPLGVVADTNALLKANGLPQATFVVGSASGNCTASLSPSPLSSTSVDSAAIIGISVGAAAGGLVLVAAAVGLVVWHRRRQRRLQEQLPLVMDPKEEDAEALHSVPAESLGKLLSQHLDEHGEGSHRGLVESEELDQEPDTGHEEESAWSSEDDGEPKGKEAEKKQEKHQTEMASEKAKKKQQEKEGERAQMMEQERKRLEQERVRCEQERERLEQERRRAMEREREQLEKERERCEKERRRLEKERDRLQQERELLEKERERFEEESAREAEERAKETEVQSLRDRKEEQEVGQPLSEEGEVPLSLESLQVQVRKKRIIKKRVRARTEESLAKEGGALAITDGSQPEGSWRPVEPLRTAKTAQWTTEPGPGSQSAFLASADGGLAPAPVPEAQAESLPGRPDGRQKVKANKPRRQNTEAQEGRAGPGQASLRTPAEVRSMQEEWLSQFQHF